MIQSSPNTVFFKRINEIKLKAPSNVVFFRIIISFYSFFVLCDIYFQRKAPDYEQIFVVVTCELCVVFTFVVVVLCELVSVA